MKERPIEPNCFETEREEQWHDVGYYDGYKDALDKACESYRKELSEIIRLFNHFGKKLHNIEDLGELVSLEGSVNDFRKAME